MTDRTQHGPVSTIIGKALEQNPQLRAVFFEKASNSLALASSLDQRKGLTQDVLAAFGEALSDPEHTIRLHSIRTIISTFKYGDPPLSKEAKSILLKALDHTECHSVRIEAAETLVDAAAGYQTGIRINLAASEIAKIVDITGDEELLPALAVKILHKTAINIGFPDRKSAIKARDVLNSALESIYESSRAAVQGHQLFRDGHFSHDIQSAQTAIRETNVILRKGNFTVPRI